MRNCQHRIYYVLVKREITQSGFPKHENAFARKSRDTDRRCNYACERKERVSSCCFNKCKTRLEYSCQRRMIPFVVATSLASSSPLHLENESQITENVPLLVKTFF